MTRVSETLRVSFLTLAIIPFTTTLQGGNATVMLKVKTTI